jgi:hypothetical protein
MYDETEKIGEEMALTYIKVEFQHLSERNEGATKCLRLANVLEEI